MTAAASPPPRVKIVDPLEEQFTSWDGTPLFYRAWWPHGTAGIVGPRPTEALVLFHRGHEHSGRFTELVAKLGVLDRGIPAFAWDARGHGLSPGDRGYAPDFLTLVRDVEAFVQHIHEAYGIPASGMSILAHSVGSVIVAAWVHDYAPEIRRMVLVAPAFRVKLYVPMSRQGLRIIRTMRERPFVRSYVTGKMLTHDPLQAASYDGDPLISKQIAVNILLEMHDAASRVVADAGAIGVPTMVLTAGKDRVVKNRAILRFYEGLSSAVKRHKHYPGFYHAILCERGRDEAIGDIRSFLEEPLPVRHDTIAEESYTRKEYERLCVPLGPGPRALKFALQRAFMKTLGQLSEGIRIGYHYGFDSGESLDHVYGDRAGGTTIFGKIIDREYIDARGWRGIRQRRVHLELLLEDAISRVLRDPQWKSAVRLTDVAAGPGRYLLETLRRHAHQDIAALLRDFSESALAEGRKIAQTLGVSRAQFEWGDAFSEESLASARVDGARPNIGIVSGLYELFPENDKVEGSLRGFARLLERGGYLLYTCQPWHPQMEMIARTLPNREGKPWVMRRRTQSEMDRLVREAGFEKIRMEIDAWGIFSVSLARRIGAAGTV